MDHNAIMLATVSTSIDAMGLTDDELAGLNLIAALDMDPRKHPVYEKAKGLFTEQGGTRMHQVAKDALHRIAEDRLIKR